MILLPRAPVEVYGARGLQDGDLAPGSWAPIAQEADVWHRRFAWAIIRCPQCSRLLTLSRQRHVVADDGTVSPSLVCPYPNLGCSWHVFVRLDGWDRVLP